MGVAMCDACVKCITCCGCCGACGNERGRSRKKDYTPMPPTPQPYHGYQPPQTIMVYPQAPQTASFDQPSKSAKVKEDALPYMPSWDNAVTKRIEDSAPAPTARARGTDLEMGRIPPAQTQSPLPRLNSGPTPYQAPAASPLHSQAHAHDYGNPYNYPSNAGAQHTGRFPQPQGYTDPYASTYNNDNYDNNTHYTSDPYDNRTFSPAPTYNTLPPPGHHYDEDSAFLSHTPRSPYPTTRNSGFQSPPLAPAVMPSLSPRIDYQDPYHHERNQPYPQEIDTRPPSLLIAGRKPVPGSQREI